MHLVNHLHRSKIITGLEYFIVGRQNDLSIVWSESFAELHIDIYYIKMNLLICTLYLEYRNVRVYVKAKDNRPYQMPFQNLIELSLYIDYC